MSVFHLNIVLFLEQDFIAIFIYSIFSLILHLKKILHLSTHCALTSALIKSHTQHS